MKKITIREEFQEDYISRAAGEKLRRLILESHQKKEPVLLDFSGIVIASTSFFDEGIAKLKFEGWNSDQLRASVRFEGLHPQDKTVLEKVCKFRGLRITPA